MQKKLAIVAGKYIDCEITEKYNSEISFGESELISLLFYLGYLTIGENEIGETRLRVPNEMIRKVYTNYFLVYKSYIIVAVKDELYEEEYNKR